MPLTGQTLFLLASPFKVQHIRRGFRRKGTSLDREGEMLMEGPEMWMAHYVR